MKMTSNGLAEGSLPFDPQAAAVGISRAAGTVGIAGAEGIVDGVLGERRAVAAVVVTRRIGVVGVRAQLAVIISLLVIEPWRVGGERIRRGLVAERTTVGTEGIFDAVRVEWASGSEGIDRRVRIKRIGVQIAEIVGGVRERQWKDEQNNKDHPHGGPPINGAAGEKRLLLDWGTAQAGQKRFMPSSSSRHVAVRSQGARSSNDPIASLALAGEEVAGGLAIASDDGKK